MFISSARSTEFWPALLEKAYAKYILSLPIQTFYPLSSSSTFTSSSSSYKTTDAITTSPRLHGSYEALKYGSVLDGLADLTGGVAECLPLRGDPTGSGRLLVELLDMTSVITANIQVGGGGTKLSFILFKTFVKVF